MGKPSVAAKNNRRSGWAAESRVFRAGEICAGIGREALGNSVPFSVLVRGPDRRAKSIPMHFPLLLRLFLQSTVLASAGLIGVNLSATVTIMPLGDSITEGGEGFQVYRYPLMEKLKAAGYDVAYVGSKTTRAVPGSPLGELRHEGYSGQNIGFLKSKFGELYRLNPADILLIHSGHNQFADQHPVPGMVRDVREIITQARAINSKVIVLLAQVIPSGKLPKYAYIPEYNQALVGLAAELNTAAQPVVLVNQADGFSWETDTIGDHVHPNAQGAEKMAVRWFEALQKVLPAPVKRAEVPSGVANPSVGAPLTLRLWPGDAPGLRANPGPEVAEAAGRVSNVSVPTLDVYLPPRDRANGAAIIICSGGGYVRLAAGPLGKGAAEVFGPSGYAVFSLKYRVRPSAQDAFPEALADARRAVRLVRSHAAEWGIDPRRIGMVGFSAGANLILNLATSADAGRPDSADPVERFSCRPDFVGLAATWSNNQKIVDLAVDGRVPPAFVMHARDDGVARFGFASEIEAAWKQAGVPVELHVYDRGGHMAFNFPKPAVDEWPARFSEWLRRTNPAR